MILVLIALLFFAVAHTLLAGRFKPFFRRRFGERAFHGLYRILYNIFAFITLAPALALVALRPGGIVWNIPLVYEPILFGIQLVGLVGLAVSLLQIDFLRFAGLSQVWAYINGQPLPLPDERLQTGGVFRLVRHPLYLFSLLATWPVTVMTEAYLGFCIGVTLYFMIGSLLEEQRLEAAYGDAYTKYRERVAWMIPFLRLP